MSRKDRFFGAPIKMYPCKFVATDLDLTGIDVIIYENFEEGVALNHADLRISVQSLLSLF
jgi:hypothetical protein